MDLELTDEQTMLSEALTTLLQREWLPAETAHTATPEQRARLWSALREFFDEELGAVELCLAARLFGAHLASTPFLGSAALRYVGVPHRRSGWRSRWAGERAVEHAGTRSIAFAVVARRARSRCRRGRRRDRAGGLARHRQPRCSA